MSKFSKLLLISLGIFFISSALFHVSAATDDEITQNAISGMIIFDSYPVPVGKYNIGGTVYYVYEYENPIFSSGIQIYDEDGLRLSDKEDPTARDVIIAQHIYEDMMYDENLYDNFNNYIKNTNNISSAMKPAQSSVSSTLDIIKNLKFGEIEDKELVENSIKALGDIDESFKQVDNATTDVNFYCNKVMVDLNELSLTVNETYISDLYTAGAESETEGESTPVAAIAYPRFFVLVSADVANVDNRTGDEWLNDTEIYDPERYEPDIPGEPAQPPAQPEPSQPPVQPQPSKPPVQPAQPPAQTQPSNQPTPSGTGENDSTAASAINQSPSLYLVIWENYNLCINSTKRLKSSLSEVNVRLKPALSVVQEFSQMENNSSYPASLILSSSNTYDALGALNATLPAYITGAELMEEEALSSLSEIEEKIDNDHKGFKSRTSPMTGAITILIIFAVVIIIAYAGKNYIKSRGGIKYKKEETEEIKVSGIGTLNITLREMGTRKVIEKIPVEMKSKDEKYADKYKTKTDQMGLAVFKEIQAGRYTITINSKKYEPYSYDTVVSEGTNRSMVVLVPK